MKKYLLPLILYICLLNQNVAQEIPEFSPSGAHWYYDIAMLSGSLDNRAYSLIEYIADTMINGLDAKVLVETHHTVDSNVVKSKEIIIRQEGWKIHYLVGGEFKILYDFGLVPGDTMRIVSEPDGYNGESDTVVIATIDSLLEWEVNGIKLRGYKSQVVNNTGLSFAGQTYFLTGFLGYLLPTHEFLCDADICPLGIRCYEDNNIQIKFRNYDCEALTVSTFDHYEPDIFVYISPVPASEYIRIKSEKSFIGDVIIYDINGRELWQEKSYLTGEPINIHHLAPGVYVAKLTRADKKIINPVRFIVN